MRRSEKEITDFSVIKDVLENNSVCRLAMVDGAMPYIVPMYFGYSDNAIYLHSAKEGKKIDLLKINNNVCVEVTDSIEIISSNMACNFSARYRSVICTGKANFITERVQLLDGLKTILDQCAEKRDWNIPDSALSGVCVLKIEIESFSGKFSR